MDISLIICDDHQLVIDGLKALIEGEPGLILKGTANNGAEAIRLIENLKLDLVLMDLDMPQMNGIEATRLIKSKHTDLKVIILTMHDEKSMIKMLMDLGADGYVLKNADRSELLSAIRNVAAGKKHFSPEVTVALLSPDENPVNQALMEGLTEREIEILKLIAEGLSNKEIGDRLFISHRTVDTHRTNLMKKLEVHNIAGLIRFAIKHGLLSE
jgi:DNA-binding NarL/FixJ family response regulator